MAAINVVEASVTWSGPKDTKVAGGTVTQGMPGYLDIATGKYKALDVDTAAGAVFAGWFLGSASDGQPVELGYGDGELNVGGALLTVGVTYYGGPAGGDIVPRADVTAGMIVAILGVARTTALLRSGSVSYMSEAGAVSA